MKKYLSVIPLVLLLFINFGCQQGEEVIEKPVLDLKADVEAIKNLIEECSRAWNEGNYEDFMAIIDEEAVFLPPNAPPVAGMETIRSIYRNEFDTSDFNLTITTQEIQVCGDLAFSLDNWKGSANPKDGSESTVFDNKNLIIYKRQADGSWKTWRVMFSSNSPLPRE